MADVSVYEGDPFPSVRNHAASTAQQSAAGDCKCLKEFRFARSFLFNRGQSQ